MGKPRLVPNDSHTKRCVARQALADAISRRDRRRLTLEQARTGIENAERYVSEAHRQQEQAIAAVEAARKQQRASIQEAAIEGRRSGPDQRLRQARMAETEAADNLEATKEALANLRAKIDPLESELQLANADVSKAAKVVMADEIGEWPQQFLQLHRHYVAQLAALDWLVKQDIVPQQGDGGPTPAGTVVFNVQYAPQVLMREVQSDSHPSRIKWQQAFTALCLDADSELPE
jgi:hypothetical protein